MTDEHIQYISKADIVNGTCRVNLSDEQIAAVTANTCIAVMASITCENPIFDTDTLCLFKCTFTYKLHAEEYIVELLSEESIYTYVQVQIQEIIAGASYD